MSGDRAIDPLPLDQFPTEAETQDPGFEQLFGDLVGDAGTPADGFEDDLAIANSLLDSLDAALTELSGQTGGTLDDTFLEILSVDPQPALDDVNNLTAALPDVQTNVDNLGNLLAGAGLPPPPAAGGGGGGGGTATACPVVDLGQQPEFTGGLFTNLIVPLHVQNPTANNLTLQSATFNPPYTPVSSAFPPIFSLDRTLAGVVIAPGASFPFNVVVKTAGDGPIDTTLTIQTDAPDPQPCVEIKLEIIPGSPSGGGTGPGGPVGSPQPPAPPPPSPPPTPPPTAPPAPPPRPGPAPVPNRPIIARIA